MFYSHGRYLKVKKKGVLSSQDLAAELKKAGVTLVNDVSGCYSVNSSSCESSLKSSSRSSGTGGRGAWTPEDSRKAVVRKRLAKRTEKESDESVMYRKEKVAKETEALEARNKRMEARPWREMPLIEHDETRSCSPSLVSRAGNLVPNPQARLAQTFQPLQYSTKGAFDEILLSKKKGADFSSTTPRMPSNVRSKSASPHPQLSTLTFSYTSINPASGKSFGKSSRSARSASLSPCPVSAYLDNDNDPRVISYPRRNVVNLSHWAASKTPRLSAGSPTGH